MFEDRNLLFIAVFENTEIFLCLITDGMVILVSDIDVNFSKIHVHIEFVDGLLGPEQGRHKQWDEH